MRKFTYLLAALALLFWVVPAEATNTNFYSFVNTATPAGSLTGSELTAITKGGSASFQTTTGAIAALAGGGQGPNTFNVTAYGAKCDGTILYTGLRTATGSNIVGNDYYTFTTADIGKHVSILGPAAVNQSGVSSTPFPNTFVGTITGVSGGHALLSANVPFTMPFSGANYQGAALRMYLTDDTAAIQAALNGANASGTFGLTNNMSGTDVVFPNGVCASGALTFYSGQHIRGTSKAASVVMLKNGANTDLFRGFQTTFPGSGTALAPAYTVYGFIFSDIQLDGNRSANTGTNEGTYGDGTGDGIRAYAANLIFRDIAVNFFAADGIYTSWANTAGVPCTFNGICSNGVDAGFESWWSRIDMFYNAGYGIVYGGPGDSNMDGLIMAYNGIGGILLGIPGGTGGIIHNLSNSHTYANGQFGYVDNLGTGYTNCEAEGNAPFGGGSGTLSTAGWVCNATCGLTNSYTANLNGSAGMITGSGAVLSLNGSALNNVTIGNASTTAANFLINSNVGTINAGSANMSLNPNTSIIENHWSPFITPPQVIYSHTTSSSSGAGLGPFQLINSGGNIAFHVDDAGKIGIGTATPAATATLDVRGVAATNGIISNGTTFTVASGCGTVGSVTGGATVGSFTAGQTGCAPVLTLPTAPHGWICHVKDLTTPADAFTQSATTTTSCTSSATVTNGDTILFDAIGY